MTHIKAKKKIEQPNRMDYAFEKLIELGFDPDVKTEYLIELIIEGQKIKLFPYSGWFTGKPVASGRGINTLISRLLKLQDA